MNEKLRQIVERLPDNEQEQLAHNIQVFLQTDEAAWEAAFASSPELVSVRKRYARKTPIPIASLFA